MKIAIGHKARSGKDTMAAYLAQKYNAAVLHFATPVYQCAASIRSIIGYDPTQKDPTLLQYVGQGIREIYGPDIWLRALETQLEAQEAGRSVVVADLRYVNEAEFLRANGFTLVKVHRPNRPLDRDPTHISEVALDGYEFDHEIINNGTLLEFYEAIDLLVSEL